MHTRSLRTLSFAAGAVLSLGLAAASDAQAWNYPSFQTPRTTTREFNFGLSDGGSPAGNAFIFQWREGRTARTQLSLDLGFAEAEFGGPGNDQNYFLVGGQLARQLLVSRTDMPFDLLMTAGVNAAFGEGGPLLSIPFGASVGHRFMIDGGMALTPYLHPRVALDYCGDCDGGDSEMEIGLVVDLGLSFDVTPNVAFRLSGSFGDDGIVRGDDAIGVSLAWTTGFVRR